MSHKFVSIDVETANARLATICQIGIVTFADGKVVDKWESLVDPEDYFDDINISIHGITTRTVRGAPTLPVVHAALHARLQGQVVVSHTSFDRASMSQAMARYKLDSPECRWLDSARVARRAWSEFSTAGYGLSKVCKNLGIEFEHHNAVEDARAAGEVLLHAMAESGLDLDGWFARVQHSINPSTEEPIRRSGNPDGLFAGNEIVFTGALMIPRREAADLAASAGCTVGSSVRKTTTILVVGDQDVTKLAGHEKSSKHRKAEELITAGYQIRIIAESDFARMVNLETSS
jgi:DNA polymerase III subunit epsilon